MVTFLRTFIFINGPLPHIHEKSLQGTFKCECVPPYYGTHCRLSPCVPELDGTPCLNNGTCTLDGGTTTGYTCSCLAGYSGPTCELTPCAPDPCLNEGVCSINGHTYTCDCKPGWKSMKICIFATSLNIILYMSRIIFLRIIFEQTGVNCETTPCFNGGEYVFVPRVLTAGIMSNIRVRRSNAGQFLPNPVKDTFSCRCVDGWIGEFCEKSPCSPNPCLNGGTCAFDKYNTAENPHYCTCPVGYSGRNCQGSECTINPCLYG